MRKAIEEFQESLKTMGPPGMGGEQAEEATEAKQEVKEESDDEFSDENLMYVESVKKVTSYL